MNNQQRLSLPHLLDEPPILIYPSLAKTLGINGAVIFQQLHFLLNITKSVQGKPDKTTQKNYNHVDGKWWVYNSYPEWQTYFPWLTERTIQKHFLELEKMGIVRSRQGVKNKSDRRKWYTIDDEAWRNYCTTMTKKVRDDHEKSSSSTMTKKVRDGYTEKENTTETTTLSPDGDFEPDGSCPSMIENQKSLPAGEDWLAYTTPSPDPEKQRTPKQQHRDDLMLAVAWAWGIDLKTRGGPSRAGLIANFLIGTTSDKQKGTAWEKHRLDVSFEDGQEIIGFKLWYLSNPKLEDASWVEKPESIARWALRYLSAPVGEQEQYRQMGADVLEALRNGEVVDLSGDSDVIDEQAGWRPDPNAEYVGLEALRAAQEQLKAAGKFPDWYVKLDHKDVRQ